MTKTPAGGSTPTCSTTDVNLIFDYSYRALEGMERRAWTALSIMPASFDRLAGRAVIASVTSNSEDGNPTDTGELLDRVVCLNLLDYDEERERHSWHDLLREFAGVRLPENQAETARLRHAEHFSGVAGRAEELYLQGHEYLMQGLALFDQERTHFEAAFDFLLDNDRDWQFLVLPVATRLA